MILWCILVAIWNVHFASCSTTMQGQNVPVLHGAIFGTPSSGYIKVGITGSVQQTTTSMVTVGNNTFAFIQCPFAQSQGAALFLQTTSSLSIFQCSPVTSFSQESNSNISFGFSSLSETFLVFAQKFTMGQNSNIAYSSTGCMAGNTPCAGFQVRGPMDVGDSANIIFTSIQPISSQFPVDSDSHFNAGFVSNYALMASDGVNMKINGSSSFYSEVATTLGGNIVIKESSVQFLSTGSNQVYINGNFYASNIPYFPGYNPSVNVSGNLMMTGTLSMNYSSAFYTANYSDAYITGSYNTLGHQCLCVYENATLNITGSVATGYGSDIYISEGCSLSVAGSISSISTDEPHEEAFMASISLGYDYVSPVLTANVAVFGQLLVHGVEFAYHVGNYTSWGLVHLDAYFPNVPDQGIPVAGGYIGLGQTYLAPGSQILLQNSSIGTGTVPEEAVSLATGQFTMLQNSVLKSHGPACYVTSEGYIVFNIDLTSGGTLTLGKNASISLSHYDSGRVIWLASNTSLLYLQDFATIQINRGTVLPNALPLCPVSLSDPMYRSSLSIAPNAQLTLGMNAGILIPDNGTINLYQGAVVDLASMMTIQLQKNASITFMYGMNCQITGNLALLKGEQVVFGANNNPYPGAVSCRSPAPSDFNPQLAENTVQVQKHKKCTVQTVNPPSRARKHIKRRKSRIIFRKKSEKHPDGPVYKEIQCMYV